MEEVKQNKMAVAPMKKLFWKMGLPMIISMVLQALYNVVDSIFVTNMGEKGAIANEGNCVIVGRAADYILKDNPNLIKVFLYAPLEYKINKIKEIYNDTEKEAKKYIAKSDKARAT